MATISDYNKYAQLATAAYVRMGVEPLTGQRFAEVAREQFRLPLSIAEYLFDPDNEYGAPVWTVAHYFGGDMPEYDDNSGRQTETNGSGLVCCVKMLVESAGETFRVSRTFFQGGDDMAEGGKLPMKMIGHTGQGRGPGLKRQPARHKFPINPDQLTPFVSSFRNIAKYIYAKRMPDLKRSAHA